MGWVWVDGATWAWERADRAPAWAAKAAWDKRGRTSSKSESLASISFRGKGNEKHSNGVSYFVLAGSCSNPGTGPEGQRYGSWQWWWMEHGFGTPDGRRAKHGFRKLGLDG